MKGYLISFVLAVLLGSLIGMDQTGRGMLVESRLIENHWRSESGMLQCHYLVGFEILVQEVRYAPNNFQGRSKCAGSVQLSQRERERLRAQSRLRRQQERSR